MPLEQLRTALLGCRLAASRLREAARWQLSWLLLIIFIIIINDDSNKPLNISFRCQAKLYLKDDKDFCSIAANGKLALIGVVNVPVNDARSVAVSIVPKKIGEIQIEVSSILLIKFRNGYIYGAADTVKKTLLVLVCTLYWST